MIDMEAVALALRNRARSLVVSTTGVVSLSATATGFARTAGSFVTDGFVEGEEIVPAGFVGNTPRVITNVSALALITSTAPAAEGAAGGRSLTVGFPLIRTYENRAPTGLPAGAVSIPTGRVYVDENFVPATHELLSFPAQGGTAEETGLYVLTWFGLENTGSAGIRKPMDGLKALFTPGTVLVAGSGTVRVRGDTSTQVGQIIPQGNGWAACQIRIPWRAYSLNVVAA